jgi:hypothetical protein
VLPRPCSTKPSTPTRSAQDCSKPSSSGLTATVSALQMREIDARIAP